MIMMMMIIIIIIAVTQSIFKLGPRDFVWKQIQIISNIDYNDDDDYNNDDDDDNDDDDNDDDDNEIRAYLEAEVLSTFCSCSQPCSGRSDTCPEMSGFRVQK